MLLNLQDTLGHKVGSISINDANSIPWIVRFLENPQSNFFLPGRINLINHNCFQVLLEQGTTSSRKAFVIGFCMGNDPDTQNIHLSIFLFFAVYVYPKKYRFNRYDLIDFKAGFNYGKTVENKRLNKVKFSCFYNYDVPYLQNTFGIYSHELILIKQKIRYQKIGLGFIRSTSSRPLAKLLRSSSSLFAVVGGSILALKIDISSYGFLLLAFSSFQLLVSSLIEKDKSLTIYAGSVFLCVDSLGIYRWLLN